MMKVAVEGRMPKHVLMFWMEGGKKYVWYVNESDRHEIQAFLGCSLSLSLMLPDFWNTATK